mmetsp:Transcript_2565/g.9784  ORF Transcript_2565/g.9784 Transcript_2565/m.9784 type:complete len:119 (+) Transcript_2565:2144-2500(+)
MQDLVGRNLGFERKLLCNISGAAHSAEKKHAWERSTFHGQPSSLRHNVSCGPTDGWVKAPAEVRRQSRHITHPPLSSTILCQTKHHSPPLSLSTFTVHFHILSFDCDSHFFYPVHKKT